jgi:hypothetical protein
MKRSVPVLAVALLTGACASVATSPDAGPCPSCGGPETGGACGDPCSDGFIAGALVGPVTLYGPDGGESSAPFCCQNGREYCSCVQPAVQGAPCNPAYPLVSCAASLTCSLITERCE